MGGMRHVYPYLTEYRKMPLAESKPSFRILTPLPNANCMHCQRTTETAAAQAVREAAESARDREPAS